MIFNKRKLIFVSAIFLLTGLIIFGFAFDSENTNAVTSENEPTPTDFYITEEEQQAMNKEKIEKAASLGRKSKALSDVTGIDETVIIVNGYQISRRHYENKKLEGESMDSPMTVKNCVDSLVQTFAIKSEAERLNIKPLQQDIDNYMEQYKKALESKSQGTEIPLAYIEALGISVDEYLIELEKSVYNMFQREEFRKYLESEKGITDFDKYFDELAKKADVEFLDPEIEKLYNE